MKQQHIGSDFDDFIEKDCSLSAKRARSSALSLGNSSVR